MIGRHFFFFSEHLVIFWGVADTSLSDTPWNISLLFVCFYLVGESQPFYFWSGIRSPHSCVNWVIGNTITCKRGTMVIGLWSSPTSIDSVAGVQPASLMSRRVTWVGPLQDYDCPVAGYQYSRTELFDLNPPGEQFRMFLLKYGRLWNLLG